MTLTARILKLLAIPATSHELAAILDAPHRTVYALLCQLNKQGRAKRLTHKRDNRRGPPSAIWGRPTMKFLGYLNMNSLSRSSGVVTAAVRNVEPNSFPATGATRGGCG